MSVYNETLHRGFLRHIVTRISYQTRDVMLIFVTSSEDHPKNRLNEICEILQAKFPEIKSFIQNINAYKGNRVLGNKNITLMGHDKITDYIMGHAFEISPLSFLQVNPIQTEVLYKNALEMANIKRQILFLMFIVVLVPFHCF